MSRSCIECVHNNPNDPSDLAYACLNCSWPPFAGEPTNFKPKPLTNYDLLIRKTPEELAEWLETIRMYCANDLCRHGCPLEEICYSKADVPTETLDWLKEEASE